MPVYTSSQAAVIQAMSVETPGDDLLDENSAYHMLTDLDGRHVSKSLTLNGNGATTTNLFQVTETCRVIRLFCYCTEATDSTTLSNFKFELWDGTAALDITSTVNASGAVAGASLVKELVKTSALIFLNPTTGLVDEPSANKKTFEPFFAVQKTGGIATYIRVSYTGDATSDTDWTFELHFVPFGEVAKIEAV